MPLRYLEPDHIQSTAQSLSKRIVERFPGSGLSKIALEVVELSQRSSERVTAIRRPHAGVRALSAALLVLLFALLATVVYFSSRISLKDPSLPDFFQMLDAMLNIVLLCGAGTITIASLERRVKRKRALGALQELRALVHVIDMHQLTKDPSFVVVAAGRTTPSSPSRTTDRFLLVRYLDYCSELLSLLSKIAALYARSFDDEVVLDAADSVENLSMGISRKVWQKIGIASAGA